jgi:hypothetical protein
MGWIKDKDDKHHYKLQASARRIALEDSDNVVLYPAFVFSQKTRSTLIHVGWPREKYGHPIVVYVSASGAARIPESVHLARKYNRLFVQTSTARTEFTHRITELL